MSWPAVGNPFFRQYNGFDLLHYNHTLAPFFDANQDGKYTPQYGDYPLPENVSNQTIPALTTWCIFNDNGGLHTAALRSTPLQAEVHLTTWAFDCDTNLLLNRTVFTSHKVINRGLTPIDSMSIGFWTDFDIGCPDDDAIGCSPSTHTFYGYNAALQESNTCFGTQPAVSFTKKPPAQAVTFLNRPLSKFIAFNGGQVCDAIPALNPPTTHSEYFNILNGRWRDGSPLTYGGIGYQTGASANFMFPDDPNNAAGWSVPTALIGCSFEMRALGSTYIGVLQSNDTTRFDAAWSFHQDTTFNAWQNVTSLRREVASIQTWYNNRFVNICSTRTATVDTDGVEVSVSPNPAQTFLTLNFGNKTLKQVLLINTIGQIVLNDIKNDSHSTILDISHLPKGLYIMNTRFENGKGRVQKIMKF